MAERKNQDQQYRVVGGVSTRKEPRPDCNDWLNWNDGDTVAASAFPAHVPLDEWIASGHLVPIGSDAAPAAQEE